MINLRNILKIYAALFTYKQKMETKPLSMLLYRIGMLMNQAQDIRYRVHNAYMIYICLQRLVVNSV